MIAALKFLGKLFQVRSSPIRSLLNLSREFVRASTTFWKLSPHSPSLLHVPSDIPDVYEASSYADDTSETPALFKDREKARSTPTEPMTNEAWIQWMDDEMAVLHGKPMFELRPS